VTGQRLRHLARALAVFAPLAAAACHVPQPQGNARPDSELASLIRDELPANVQHRTFINFGDKLHLVGYDVEPSGVVAPGSRVTLRLYWRVVGPVAKGWTLQTHITDASGQLKLDADNIGVLRAGAKLPPSEWQVGKVVIDEQEFELPRSLRSEATIRVAVLRGALSLTSGTQSVKVPDVRLPVIGGAHDSENRGIVAHVSTGIRPLRRPVRSRRT
jgi:hypothetical protein